MSTAPATLFDLDGVPGSRSDITPRYYQLQDHDETFRLFDAGTRGVLTRGFTGCGKSLQTCLKADTWLQRGPNYHVLILSYEQELVNQFAREVWDYLGKRAGIEMGEQRVDYGNMPEIVIASRQSLLCWPEPTRQQKEALATFGITDTGSVCERHVKRYLKLLQAGTAEPQDVKDEIGRLSMEPEAHNGKWSRVHRFDWHYNWMIAADEAHKFAYHLKTVGHLSDWFGQNPETRWSGVTATPKRSDGVSIGHRMFPGIALDLPLYKPDEPCGVSDGWAVPYVQRYIEVEGVDFRSINRIGQDFDEADLERVLGEEAILAKLVEPLLDMVGDRQTLIFSPGVQMAKDVAEYINARSRCVCTCGLTHWHPTLLIGDGAVCPGCGRMAEPGDIDKHPEQAKELDGNVPSRDRTPIYEEHQAGKFQFLSIVGLCREGYNDPNISCVAVFRPVSRAASSLAEQMKGRSCRALRGLLDEWPRQDQRELRLEAIRNSSKPNCVARGTPILTDHGEIPIESVTRTMKVWDGLEFVTHSGIISRGYSEVVTYLGLSATADHEVMVYDEKNPTPEKETWTAFGDCAAQQAPIRVTGIGGLPVRETDRRFREGDPRDRRKALPPQDPDRVRLRSAITERLLGTHCQSTGMPEVRSTRAISTLAMAAVCDGATAMPEPERQELPPIRSEGHQVLLSNSIRHGTVGAREPWLEQGFVTRPDRQQWSLCGRESALRPSNDPGQQSAWPASHGGSPCVLDCPSRDSLLARSSATADSSGVNVEGHHRPSQWEARWHRTQGPISGKVEVFDILNAGPRHRFTAAGLLVSNSLIVDLVGITGLADCASTVQIYTEGLPDEISRRAEEILLADGSNGTADVGEAIEQAKREDAEARARAKAEREAAERHSRELAERRAKAGAEVTYTTHESGIGSQVNANEATEKQYKMAAFLGIEIQNTMLTKRQMGRIIGQLQAKVPLEEVARTNGIDERNWQAIGPTAKQKWAMHGMASDWVKTRAEASMVIDASRSPASFLRGCTGPSPTADRRMPSRSSPATSAAYHERSG